MMTLSADSAWKKTKLQTTYCVRIAGEEKVTTDGYKEVRWGRLHKGT